MHKKLMVLATLTQK